MIKNFGENKKTKLYVKVAIYVIILLLFFAFSLSLSFAWYKGTMSANGSLRFDPRMTLQFSGFDYEDVRDRNGTKFNVTLVENSVMQEGTSVYPEVVTLNRLNDANLDTFYIRSKLSYDLFTTAEGTTPVSQATLESENFDIRDMLDIYGMLDSKWVRSTDGWFYYSTDGSSLATLPTTATNLFLENAHFVVKADSFSTNTEANYTQGGKFKVSNSLSIAKVNLVLTLELLNGTKTPANEGWTLAEDKSGICADFLKYYKICELGETTDISGSASSLTDAASYDVLDRTSNKGFRVQVSGSNLTVTAPVNSPTNVEIPKYLVIGENEYTVTAIGTDAFKYCSTLKSIKLPSSVANIEDWVFRGCSNLDSFTASGTYTTLDHGNLLMINGSKVVAFAPNGITSYTIPNTVTNLGKYAFGSCSNLISVTIPDSVGTFNSSVFIRCTNLVNVTIGNRITFIGSYAFQYCSSLANITIPNNVTTINTAAFYGCTNLASIKIGNGVTTIQTGVFTDCSNLKTVYIDSKTISDDLTSDSVFGGLISNATTIYIKQSNVASLGSYVASTSNFPYVTPNVVVDGITYTKYEKAGVYTLKNSSDATVATNASLTAGQTYKLVNSSGNGYSFTYAVNNAVNEVTITGAVGTPTTLNFVGTLNWNGNTYVAKTIANNAFNGNTTIADVYIPEGVTNINSNAFRSCSNLENISIPTTLSKIGDWIFDGCSSLNFTVENYVKYLGCEANPYVYLEKLSTTNRTTYSINSNCKAIAAGAFGFCSNLTSITLPESVVSIGSEQFKSCLSLDYFVGNSTFTTLDNGNILKKGTTLVGFAPYEITEYSIPNTITSISGNAFMGCSNLQSIKIPTSLTSTISDYAFSGCSNLKTVYIDNNTVSNGLSAQTSKGRVVNYADTVYIKSNCSAGTYITNNFPFVTENVVVDGTTYTKYEKSTVYNLLDSNGDAVATNASLTAGDTYKLVKASGTDSGKGYSFTYSVNNAVNEVTITGAVDTPTTLNFVGTINWNGSEYVADSIAENAFKNNSTLTSVEIPSSVTSIGGFAFRGCSSLASITIPSGVTSIGNGAFYGCSRLASITIPSSVTSIGSSTFNGCSSLASITIPSSVTSIGDSAFYGCSSLASITIPSSVTNIESYAFNRCSSLASITIPSGVTSIGSSAFRDCSSLTSITIPSSVTNIGGSAFRNCSSLTSITIPSSVTNIGGAAFIGCTSLDSFIVSSGNTTYSTLDNGNVLMNGQQLVAFAPYGITTYTIPSSVTSIGSSAFSGCSSLTSITIPSSVTSIGSSAFYGCSSLTSITIPSSVTSIGSSAFNGCSSLKTVYIDNGTISSGLTSATAMGYLIRYATTVYVKTGLTAGRYLTNTTNFPYVTSGVVVDGKTYTKYSKS